MVHILEDEPSDVCDTICVRVKASHPDVGPPGRQMTPHLSNVTDTESTRLERWEISLDGLWSNRQAEFQNQAYWPGASPDRSRILEITKLNYR